MNAPSCGARVLIASDDLAIADKIRRALKSYFDQVEVSTNPNLAHSEFDTLKPDVLVLGFHGLESPFAITWDCVSPIGPCTGIV